MKNMMRKKITLGVSLCALLVMQYSSLTAYDYDGATELLVEGSQITPADTNTLYGLVWLRAGFQLPSGGLFTMSDLLPVNGVMDLNGGTLALGCDLITAGGATLTDTGGVGSASAILGYGYTIFMNNDLTYSGTTQTLSIGNGTSTGANLTIDGRGKTFTIGGSNQITVSAHNTLTLRNMILNITSSTAYPINLAATTSALILNNVRVIFNNNLEIVYGAITIQGRSSFESKSDATTLTLGNGIAGGAALTIASNAELHLDYGFTLALNNPSQNITLTDSSSRLRLTNARLTAAACDITLSVGQLITDHYSYLTASGGNIVIDTSAVNLICAPAAMFECGGGHTVHIEGSVP